MDPQALRSCWKWRNYRPGHEGGGARSDGEVLLNAAGRQLLCALCSVGHELLARVLPSWGEDGAKLPAWQHGDGSAGGAVHAALVRRGHVPQRDGIVLPRLKRGPAKPAMTIRVSATQLTAPT